MPRRILLPICIVLFATTTALESASGQYPQSKPAAAQIEGRKQVEASNPKSEEQDERHRARPNRIEDRLVRGR